MPYSIYIYIRNVHVHLVWYKATLLLHHLASARYFLGFFVTLCFLQGGIATAFDLNF